jgi:hypothetical protein
MDNRVYFHGAEIGDTVPFSPFFLSWLLWSRPLASLDLGERYGVPVDSEEINRARFHPLIYT